MGTKYFCIERGQGMDEITQDLKAMEDAIPSWEWDSEYDKIRARLAREKLKIMFGGGENDL